MIKKVVFSLPLASANGLLLQFLKGFSPNRRFYCRTKAPCNLKAISLVNNTYNIKYLI